MRRGKGLYVMIALFWIFGARISVLGTLFHFVKWNINQRCKIIIFRHFSSDAAHITRNVTIPTMGAYGEVVVLHDPTLEAGRFEGNMDLSHNADVLGFGHVLDFLGPSRSPAFGPGEDWKKAVVDELVFADLAVFCLQHQQISDNILWEMAQAIRALGDPERILVIASKNVDIDRLPYGLGEGVIPSTGVLQRELFSALKARACARRSAERRD